MALKRHCLRNDVMTVKMRSVDAKQSRTVKMRSVSAMSGIKVFGH